MSAQTMHSTDTTNTAHFPPAPPEAHQRAATLTLAITTFATDLVNSATDEDRRDAVLYLARAVGVAKANHIADLYGLTRSYYKAGDDGLSN